MPSGEQFVAVSFIDITERRETELELQRSRAFLDALIGAMPQGVGVKDESGVWVLANEALCRMSRQPVERVIGHRNSDIYGEEAGRRYDAEDAETMLEVHLYVTTRQIISIRRESCPPLQALHDRADRIVGSHTTVPALLSRILSTLVATFSDALERVDDQLTDLEGRILNEPLRKEQLDELLRVRRRVNRFRRAVDPARDLVGVGRFIVIDALEDFSDEARRDLRDLAVDLAHVGDQLEGERDRLSAVMEVYMNQVNNRQNRVMQQLATVSTVFLPLTFLTGYFGMNFGSMVADVRSPTAFVAFGVALPLAILVFSLLVIRRRGWFRGD
jgi:magnesium transporter